MKATLRLLASAALLLSQVSRAQAQEAEQPVKPTLEKLATDGASAGAMSPLLMSASLGDQRALVMGAGGYDSSRRGAIMDSAVDARVWGPIALRLGVTYSEATKRMRPSAGARAQLLQQRVQGVDASITSVFKTEGFDELEGEIETTFAIGRRFEHFYLLGNIAYGQDPEGNERDGELRTGLFYQRGHGVVGLEVRARAAIGPQRVPNAAVEPKFDAVGGPIAMYSVSSFAFFAEAGPAVVQLPGSDLRWGVASLGGVGSVF